MHNLNRKQTIALQLALSGQNLFITGEGGVGKSFLEKTLVRELRKKGNNVICMAFTGMAAQLMPEGVTIHSILKCGIGPLSPKELIQSSEVLNAVDVVIVDEISQVRMDLFATLVRALKKAEQISGKRKQLIVVGDFYQLAPVITAQDRENLEQVWGAIGEGFCFQTKEWEKCSFLRIVLDEPIRQDRNSDFYRMINLIRTGECEDIRWINENHARELFDKEITLCVKNEDADRINQEKISSLKAREETYIAQVSGEYGDELLPAELLLKVGMRVMTCVNNRSRGYMNGDMGTVMELLEDCVKISLDKGIVVFVEPYSFPNNRYTVVDGNLELETIGYFTQIPLRPAYAISIHKSQGQTYEKCNILLDGCFAGGQAYVALSRCKSVEGIHLIKPLEKKHIRTSKTVKEFYKYV